MREVITTGKTVEDATERACEELGLSREEISIEILEMPQKKFFRTIPAKVKATADADLVAEKAPVPAPKQAQAAAPIKAQAPTQAPTISKDKKPYVPPVTTMVDLATDEKAATAAAFLKDICEKMGVGNVTIGAEMRGEALIFKIEGPEVGALIGRRGETMEAMSYLSSLVANRIGGDYVKIGLDVGGYREKREGDLEALARKVCDKVQKTNRAQMLEPMNPYERRIIHSAVGELEGVRSESSGEGAHRRVVVLSTAEGAKNERPDRYDKTTPPPRSGFKSNSGGGYKGSAPKPAPRFNNDSAPRRPQASTPQREFASRPQTSTPQRDFANRPQTKEAPKATPRTESISDGGNTPLYGKIEL